LMKEKIPVNPKILEWARKSAGLQMMDVAERMKKDENTIISWERGDDSPTYIQLEKLAYQIYKRPLALFFFPEPPLEETPEQSFRTLPEYEIEMMSPRMRYLLKQAYAMQINLSELNFGVNPAERNIVKDLSFDPDTSITTLVSSVREYLKIDLETQFSWRSVDEALKAWRFAVESNGISIFKEAFKDENFSGFCYYDKQFPIIFINNSLSKTRQIFSIFHELSHLLFGIGGVDTRNNSFINHLKGNDRKIEILCNRFAGEFLVPEADFNSRITTIGTSEKTINDLAEKYRVSREVILRKFLDRKMIDAKYYSQTVKKWEIERKKRSSGTGGDYFATKGAYLGNSYLELAFSRYYQKRININQLADYLGVKVKNISGMEGLLYKRGFA